MKVDSTESYRTAIASVLSSLRKRMQDEQYPEHISPSNHQTRTTTRQEDNIQVDKDHELAQIEDAVIDALG